MKPKESTETTRFEYLYTILTILGSGKVDVELTNKANEYIRMYFTLNKTINPHKRYPELAMHQKT